MGIQQHNGNRRTAGSGRWMGMGGAARRFISICNRWTSICRVVVTDLDKRELLNISSQSVTSEVQNGS